MLIHSSLYLFNKISTNPYYVVEHVSLMEGGVYSIELYIDFVLQS